jgi:hypothetical protein
MEARAWSDLSALNVRAFTVTLNDGDDSAPR